MPAYSESSDKLEKLEKIEMTEEEMDAKLVSFKGLNNELDGEMSKTIGKLLVDEADEDVNANWETFTTLFKMVGGVKTCILFAVIKIFRKFYQIYQES